jgi:hypothetical protein
MKFEIYWKLCYVYTICTHLSPLCENEQAAMQKQTPFPPGASQPSKFTPQKQLFHEFVEF